MNTLTRGFLWLAIAGASAIGGVALHRGESINTMWFVVAAVCTYPIGYRFYSAWIMVKVLMPDATQRQESRQDGVVSRGVADVI